MVAETQEQASSGSSGHGDIWLDEPTLHFIRSGELPAGASTAEQHRIRRRARSYYLVGDQLLRRMADSTSKLVPPRSERQRLIQQQHELCGHYGVRRTSAMLLTKHWWWGLQADVAHVVSHCEHCNRVMASFTAKPQQLHSIPISSMGFRWHVDLAGPLPRSTKGNTYIMIAVEAFSKHLEAIPMPDKESATVASALLHNVIARFGAPGQVVTDSGTEFLGHFDQLLRDCMIDHCTISTDHPQANGQAEKMVQTVKRALMKVCAANQTVTDWDDQVAWISLGYRCSPQRSTGFTPYELLYARKPVVPPAVSGLLAPEVDYDNPAAAAKDLLLRKTALQETCPMALENLSIAQHRDQLRYLQVRDGTYQPQLPHFKVGDFVYVQQLQRRSTLMPRAQPLIYRVLEVRDSGVLILQGKCGRTVSMHMSHCAPCHLPAIDSSIDPRLAENIEDAICEVCGTDEKEDQLLLCDLCSLGYHTFCLTPPLSAVPDGTWICPACQSQGYTPEDAEAREQQRLDAANREAGPVLFPDSAMKKRDLAAAAKHGRLVKKVFTDPRTRQPRSYWGRVHYLGAASRPQYYQIFYEDGDTEQMGNRHLNPILQPAGTQLPTDIYIPMPERAASGRSSDLHCHACAASYPQHAWSQHSASF